MSNEDLIQHLESAANFCRGASMDRSIPPDAREALLRKAESLDLITEQAVRELES
jgi:hypothetical protein